MELYTEFCPTILVADGAPAITNGFTAAFGGILKRVMCWAHMIRKVEDRLSRISDKEIRANIRNDICFLQLARNVEIFKKASFLFMLKWQVAGTEVNQFF